MKRASGEVPDAPIYTLQNPDKADSHQIPPHSLPSPLTHTPDLDAWVRFNSDETVTLFTGKMEMGQDLRTSIAMIGADELDVSLPRIRVVMADTEQSPDEGYTGSSMSLETSGNAMRYASAEVRHIALSIAYEELEVPVDRLIINDGIISDPVTGRSVTYWALFGGKKIGMKFTGSIKPKSAAQYQIVGAPAQRLDLVAKVTGKAVFVHDLDFPDMVHGRVVRPPNAGARLIDFDRAQCRQNAGCYKSSAQRQFSGCHCQA